MSTELVNPEIDRVDAVNGPATGIPFLIFKDAQGGPAVAAESAPVAKSEDDAEDVAEEVADAEDANIDGAAVADAAIVDAEPGDAAWEAVDAAKARVAVAGLAALSKLVAELGQREDAEEPYSSDAFSLMDAGDALDFALGVLARFSVTEQMDADSAAEDAELATSRASGLLKALHLEVHEHPEEPAPAEAPAAAEVPVEDALVPEAPVVPAAPVPPVVKAADGVLPSGLMELLTTFVEGYSQYMEAQASGAKDEASPEDAPAAPAAPVEAPKAPEAPEAHAAPAEPAEAHEAAPAHAAPVAPVAPAHVPAAPAAEAPKAEAPAEAEDPAEKFKKSMQEAVAAAVAEATAPLLKQIDVLERTPVDSGPMLAGQTPDNAGTPLVRGQEEGAVAKGLSSAAAQTAPGTNALAQEIKSLYARR